MWRPPAFLYHPDAVLIVERVAGCRSVQVGSSPVQEFDHANLAEGCSPGAIGLTLRSAKPLMLASPVVSSFSTPLTSRPSMSMRSCLWQTSGSPASAGGWLRGVGTAPRLPCFLRAAVQTGMMQ